MKMQHNTHTPLCLDVVTLRRTLQALRSASAIRPDHPLLGLCLVEGLVAGMDYLNSHDVRVVALAQVLTTQITSGLSRQRGVVGLNPPDADATLDETRWAITRDGQQHNPELTGWSWLYHYYVRVDLNISAEIYCAWSQLQPRTLRRMQRRGLLRLMAHLIAAEDAARISR